MPTARTSLVRMLAIHQRVAACTNPNATRLSHELEVSVKTINRDIACMRDQFRLPIEYDTSVNGYVYTGPVESFPLLALTEGDLFAMLVARQSIEQYQGTPFAEPLRAAFAKLAAGMKGVLHVAVDTLAAPVTFRHSGVGTIDPEVFSRVSQAVVQHRELRFEHQKLGDDVHRVRLLQPYHLACVDAQWYAIGMDLVRKEMRIFALARMRNTELLNETFTVPEDFTVDNYLKNAFGVFAGEARHLVRVRFDAWAARLLRERHWNPGHQFSDLPGGGVALEMKVPALEEIEPWLLSWGDHAHVLAPEELVTRMKGHAERMSLAYAQLELFGESA